MPELRCLVTPWMPNGTLTAYIKSNHNDLTILDRSRIVSNFHHILKSQDSLKVGSWRMSALDFVTVSFHLSSQDV
jgi:hypothetical protein